MHTKYSDQVQFIITYTIEAHPVGSTSPYSGKEWTGPASMDIKGCPLTQPTTYDERVAQATQMVQELGITIPVLVDEMDNPVWCTYGPAPDSAYLIGTDGKIEEKQGWYQPELMEAAIREYVGGIDQLADLIRPFVKVDELKFYSTMDFERGLTEDVRRGRPGLPPLSPESLSCLQKQFARATLGGAAQEKTYC